MPPMVCGRCGRALRRRGLANGVRSAAACRRVELERRPWAARRTSDLGREEPAYAARISRNMDAFDCNSGDSSHATGLLRACICTCGESGIGVGAVGRKNGRTRESTDTGAGGKDGTAGSDGYRGMALSRACTVCGMSGSLRRARNLSGESVGRVGGALCRVWMTSTGCRSM